MDQTEVLELLYGEAAWEISKALTEKQQRRQAQVGLATNVVGLTAGTAAIGSEYKKFKAAGKPAEQISRDVAVAKPLGRLRKVGAFVAKHPKAFAGAGLGLQVGNVAGDVVANRVLARSAKKNTVAKRHLKKVNVNKAMFGGARQAAQDTKKTLNNTAQISSKVNSFLTPKKLAFAGTGILGGSAAGNYAGSRSGAKAGVKAGMQAAQPPKPAVAAKPMLNPRPAVGPTPMQQRQQKSMVGKAVEWDLKFEISKADDDKRQVFGWASIITKGGEPVLDLQDDIMTIETIEKAAYDYVKKSRKGGNQHQRAGMEPLHVSDMIESFVVTDEKKQALGLPDDFPTGWLVGFQVNDDDTWSQVKSGERPMFSIHGSGRRTEKEID